MPIQMKPRFNDTRIFAEHLMHDLALDMSLLVRFLRNAPADGSMNGVLDQCRRGPPGIFDWIFDRF